MTRTARWLLGLTAVVVGLLAVALLVLTVIIDPNSYRDEIEGAVRQATGRDFRLEGDIDIAWFPWLELEAGTAELGNPAGFEPGPPLLRWQRASMGVRALPLLRRQLIVDRVQFAGLNAHLRVSADGRKNWEGFATQRSAAGERAPFIPRNSGLEIRNGTLEYSDARSGTQFAISEWDLDIGAYNSGEPVAVRTEFMYRDVPVALREDALTLDLDTLRIAAPAWSLHVGDARVEGSLRSEERLERLEGDLRGQVPSLRKLLVAFGTTAPQTRDTGAIGALRLNGAWRYDRGALQVEAMEMTLDDTSLRGTLARSAPPPGEQAMWTFELAGDRIDLDRYREPDDEAPSKGFTLPVEQLKAANVRGTLTFDTARVAGTDAKDVRFTVVTDEPAK